MHSVKVLSVPAQSVSELQIRGMPPSVWEVALQVLEKKLVVSGPPPSQASSVVAEVPAGKEYISTQVLLLQV